MGYGEKREEEGRKEREEIVSMNTQRKERELRSEEAWKD